MSTLSQTIGNLHFKSPIVVAAGPLTDNVDLIKEAEENGAGAVSTKLTLFYQPVKGYRRMHAVRGMYNFNPSDKRNDLDQGVELVYKAKQATTLPIFANIAGPGDNLEGWIKIGLMMEQAGAAALELNFVCPNMAFGKNVAQQSGGKSVAGVMVGRSPNLMHEIIVAVKGAVKIPVWAKATANNVDYISSAKAIAAAGADGIITNGTQIAVPPINIYDGGKTNMFNMANNATGGLVGPVNRMYANRLVLNVAQETNLVIAGGGGISDWEHNIETIMFGATLTTMCTKLLWDGFKVIKNSNQKMLEFMEQNGYETISDMRGLAAKYIVTSDKLQVYEATPYVNEEICNGCGSCLKVGSCAALSMDDKKIYVDEAKCERCGLCGCLCPRKAISFKTE